MCSPASVLSNYRISIHVSIDRVVSTGRDVVDVLVPVVVVVASRLVDVERRFKAALFYSYCTSLRFVVSGG